MSAVREAPEQLVFVVELGGFCLVEREIAEGDPILLGGTGSQGDGRLGHMLESREAQGRELLLVYCEQNLTLVACRRDQPKLIRIELAGGRTGIGEDEFQDLGFREDAGTGAVEASSVAHSHVSADGGRRMGIRF